MKYRLTESRLRDIIYETVKKVLFETENDRITLEWESLDDTWTIPVTFTCTIFSENYAESTCSIYGNTTIPVSLNVPLYKNNGELNELEIEYAVEEEWDALVGSVG